MSKSKMVKAAQNMAKYLHENIININNSKLFAGVMIITLNIASKFVNIKLSKSMESYLKFTFSKQILIFAIAWMGTRDIYVALFIAFVFIVCVDYLFNENSAFCCLPETFITEQVSLMDSELVTEEELKHAHETIARAESQNTV
jgi:hypothetical protein